MILSSMQRLGKSFLPDKDTIDQLKQDCVRHGSPGFALGPEYPDCPLCKRVMPLLLQLDSGLQMEGDWLSAYDGEWIWGDGGPACVFWCDECRVSAIFYEQA